jgi:hypothetical protein
MTCDTLTLLNRLVAKMRNKANSYHKDANKYYDQSQNNPSDTYFILIYTQLYAKESVLNEIADLIDETIDELTPV